MAVKKIVKTEFKASGNLEKKFTLMERAAARFGRSADKSFRRANRGASRFASTTKGVVAGLGISRGLGLLTQGIGAVTTGFIAFDKAALGATVRFKDIGPEAANFNDQLKIIQKSARDMGATTEFTAAQSAEALDFLARAGFTSAEAMGSLGSMIDLATASGEEFAQVADQSSDLLGAFGLNVDNTEQKIKNLNRVNDVLVKTANSANVTIEDMFETMKIAGPIATSLGIEIEEVAALTAVMGNAGIKGSMGATALKNSFLNLATQKKPVMDMLNAIGVTLQTGEGGRLKFTETLQAITEATKDMGKIKQAKVFDAIFGKRAIAGASNLSRSIGEVKDFRKSLLAAGLTSKLTAEIMRTSIDAKLKSLGSAATEAGFKILNAFEVDGKKGIDSLTKSIRDFDPTQLITALKGISLVVGVMADQFSRFIGILTKVGTFTGEQAAKTVLALTGEADPTAAFRQQVAERKRFDMPTRIGPNQQEAAAQATFPGFQGKLTIAGAPEGSTMETKSAPPGFSTDMLGEN